MERYFQGLDLAASRHYRGGEEARGREEMGKRRERDCSACAAAEIREIDSFIVTRIIFSIFFRTGSRGHPPLEITLHFQGAGDAIVCPYKYIFRGGPTATVPSRFL